MLINRLRWLAVAALTLVAAPALAQDPNAAQGLPPELRFEKLRHSFGNLKEEDNEAAYSFIVRNQGATAITLVDVKPSCGCTTPDWTREAIAPGKSGFVKAIYSTVGRPGPFEKQITVRARKTGDPADGSKDVVAILTIEGNVTPKSLGIADFYPFQSGSLRMNNNNVSFNRVSFGTKTGNLLKLYNEGNAPVTISRVDAPNYVTVHLPPNATIQPKDSLKVHVDFDSGIANDWGFVSNQFQLYTNDQKEPVKHLYVTALVVEDFSKLTAADRANAPAIQFETETHSFGTVPAGTMVTYEFKFTNTGKRDLIIRKTKPSCGCTASEPTKTVLKPGESSSILVKFDTAGRQDRQVKYITVITNDPKKDMVNLALDGTVTTGNTGSK